MAIAVDQAVMHTKPDRWVGNRHEGTEGQASHPPACCRDDFDRLDELFDLIKARDEYR